MYELPVTIDINGRECHIRNKGDYRMVLDCFSALSDIDIESDTERILVSLIIFYEDLDVDTVLHLSEEEAKERVVKMYDFFDCGQDMTNAIKSSRKLMDWEQDAQLIISAVNNVAHKEVRTEQYIHWWTFMGYYMSIGESAFSTIISIRNKILRGKKLEKHEQEFRNENPQYFIWNHKTLEEQEAENYIMDLWNGNKE